jgi:hypothetical protein
MEDSDDIAADVGNIAMAWATLEQYAWFAFAGALGTDMVRARIVAAGMPLQQLNDRTEALFRAAGRAEIADAMRIWASSIKPIHGRRNDVIHGTWTVSASGEGPRSLMDFASRKAVDEPRFDHVRPDDLPGLLDEIDTAIRVLATTVMIPLNASRQS